MLRLTDYQLWGRTIPLVRPFRFGMVELNALQHAILACDFEIDGQTVRGFAGENLVPRWFIKDADLSVEIEHGRLVQAVHMMARLATTMPASTSVFELWWRLYQRSRAMMIVRPVLLAQLAESLVERAAIDALSRYRGETFRAMLRSGALGFDATAIDPTLDAETAQAWRTASAASGSSVTLRVRHTVGLADDLATLPHTLAADGVAGLKIKLSGDADRDLEHLSQIEQVVRDAGCAIDRITLDGNENYVALDEYERFVQRLADHGLTRWLRWIEQPFRRDRALSDAVAPVLQRYTRWPVVIDESDADLGDLPRALSLGYGGTTHKSCKGVFKSMLHATRRAAARNGCGREFVFSGEDLTIVAPWSQAWDLTVAAAVGVCDIERNGQHFAAGLDGLPRATREQALANYPWLYRTSSSGSIELRIEQGAIEVRDMVIEPPPLEGFTRLP